MTDKDWGIWMTTETAGQFKGGWRSWVARQFKGGWRSWVARQWKKETR